MRTRTHFHESKSSSVGPSLVTFKVGCCSKHVLYHNPRFHLSLQSVSQVFKQVHRWEIASSYQLCKFKHLRFHNANYILRSFLGYKCQWICHLVCLPSGSRLCRGQFPSHRTSRCVARRNRSPCPMPTSQNTQISSLPVWKAGIPREPDHYPKWVLWRATHQQTQWQSCKIGRWATTLCVTTTAGSHHERTRQRAQREYAETSPIQEMLLQTIWLRMDPERIWFIGCCRVFSGVVTLQLKMLFQQQPSVVSDSLQWDPSHMRPQCLSYQFCSFILNCLCFSIRH